MKYLSFGLVFLLLLEITLFSIAKAEEHEKVFIISEKVGEVIDVQERIRYALFPQIKGFKSAVFLKLSDGNFVAEVTYEKNGDEKTTRISQSTIEIISLIDYIEKASEGKIRSISLAGEAKTGGKLVSVSGKVGASIDKSESSEYGIFINIPNFECATFYRMGKDGYVIQIQSTTDTLFSVVSDAAVVSILKDYVKRYKSVKANRASFERKWSIIAYDEQGIPITENEILGKKGSCCTLGCTLGGGAAAGFLVAFGEAISYMDRSEEPSLVPVFVGAILGGAIGYLKGSMFDRNMINKPRIIEQIRKSRAPK